MLYHWMLTLFISKWYIKIETKNKGRNIKIANISLNSVMRNCNQCRWYRIYNVNDLRILIETRIRCLWIVVNPVPVDRQRNCQESLKLGLQIYLTDDHFGVLNIWISFPKQMQTTASFESETVDNKWSNFMQTKSRYYALCNIQITECRM